MTKHKVSVRIEPGQACMVADVAFFHHISEVYRILADRAAQSDKAAWIEVADLVDEWVEKTYIPVEDDILENG